MCSWCARPLTAPGVKPDFEILVRLAGSMGAGRESARSFRRTGTAADLGQSRGAQAGEADRHAVWLEANGLEPKLSPFDPLATTRRNRASGSRLRARSYESLWRQRCPYGTRGSRPARLHPLPPPISSCRRMTISSHPERWANTAERSSNSRNTRPKKWPKPQPTEIILRPCKKYQGTSLLVPKRNSKRRGFSLGTQCREADLLTR